jgi:hypothetical protein
VLEAGRKGLKIGLRGDLEVEPIIQRKWNPGEEIRHT